MSNYGWFSVFGEYLHPAEYVEGMLYIYITLKNVYYRHRTTSESQEKL